MSGCRRRHAEGVFMYAILCCACWLAWSASKEKDQDQIAKIELMG